MAFAHITGWGMFVPEKILTNDEWIRNRTGIRERRIVSEGQSTSSLAIEASLRALQVANLRPTELDLIICSTSTPEYLFPATACIVQDKIGATKAGAFDLLAACTGFIFAVNMAAQSIRSGSIQNALVIGSEAMSRFIDWNDRETCILFGDGAGAFILQASDMPGGVLSAVMHSDGSGADSLIIQAGGSKLPATQSTIQEGKHFLEMDGREVFRFATRVMAQATKEAAHNSGLEIENIDWIIPHQANIRIIEAAARGLKLPMEKFVVNLDRYGNTSTASIPIATVEAVEDGRIQKGHSLVFVAFGAGLTWGALTAEWTGPLPRERKVYPRRYRLWASIRSVLRRLIRVIEGLIWGRFS